MVLSIATIILAVGIPAYIRGDRRQQAKGAADQLVAALRLARSQAMTSGDGVGFRDELPQGAADGRYLVYAVRQGLLDRTPVMQGDTAFVPSGIPVLQVGSTTQVNPAEPSILGDERRVDISGQAIGAVLMVHGQPILFSQDGRPAQAQSVITFDFTNGYGSWRVTLSPSGQADMAELATP